MTTLLWFGRDLRLSDNPALRAAIARGKPVVPVYILDDGEAGRWAPGAASLWWLHHSLEKLAVALDGVGSRLILRRGAAANELLRLVRETKAEAVYWNRRYEPWALSRDTSVRACLAEAGLEARSFNAGLLHEPTDVKTQAGRPYTVFTPFWRALRASVKVEAAQPAPRKIAAPVSFPASDALVDWQLLPRVSWDGGLRETWTPGEAGARRRLSAFLDASAVDYAEKRNTPSVSGTSGLSPHLHFGEIGPAQIWRAAIGHGTANAGETLPRGIETFLTEIAWREFSHHLLFHSPELPEKPLRSAFARMAWRRNAFELRAWQRGQTGYPLVDAGMRELWHTGWMHNRVRMVVASFLVKHLLIDWREGQAWFWDTLVDADLANNAASWQWVAGCGADAAPYFRVFSPSKQGATYDAEGIYVRRWVPEIAKLPNARLQAPWTAKPLELAAAGLRLGVDYPLPLVDHATARARALAAFADLTRHT